MFFGILFAKGERHNCLVICKLKCYNEHHDRNKGVWIHAGKGIRMTIREEIEQLKKEKNAVILAHYYVRPEVQEIADYIGDSFYLSKVAVELEEQTIVFCGVSFMGESAKVLNPQKTVLMPDAKADCAMAHMQMRRRSVRCGRSMMILRLSAILIQRQN